MRSLALLLLLAACTTTPRSIDLSRTELIDLTHQFDERTLYWPSDTAGFRLQQLSFGQTEGGFFYAANSLCTAEHGGTHLDAPIHFGEGKRTADEIPLRQLIGPAVVIDVRDRAAQDPDYRLQASDIHRWEQQHGRIEPGSIVLLRTGWSERWPDRLRYFGDDRPGVTDALRFPAYGEEAMRILIERQIGALGVDTASIDYGRSRDFIVHQLAAAQNIPAFENLTSLDRLPPRGAWIIALPMKIAGGSGAPLRAVAAIPR